MEAKKLTVNQVKNLVSYRLNGFVTGKRTNLQKAIKECRCDYAELGKGIDTPFPFEKVYKNLKGYFCSSGIDLYDLSNYLQEKYNF